MIIAHHNLVSETRQRLTDEIVPERATHSHSHNSHDDTNGAQNAIDLNFSTMSITVPPPGQSHSWFVVHLDLVYCIRQVARYRGGAKTKWVCGEEDCFSCSGYQCDKFSPLMVYNEDDTSYSATTTRTVCRKGDTVKLDGGSNSFAINEIVTIGSVYQGQYLQA